MAYKYLRFNYVNGSHVKLEVSDTGGSPWQEIINCEEDGDLSYLWPSIRKVMKNHFDKTLDTVGEVMQA